MNCYKGVCKYLDNGICKRDGKACDMHSDQFYFDVCHCFSYSTPTSDGSHFYLSCELACKYYNFCTET